MFNTKLPTTHINADNKDKCLFRFIRSQDRLGIPVTLNHESNNVYKTCLGGCVSIFASCLLLFLTIKVVLDAKQNPNYQQTVQQLFLPAHNNLTYEISTDDSFLAVQIYDPDIIISRDYEKYYTYKLMQIGTTNSTIKLVNCIDLYSEQLQQNPSLMTEFITEFKSAPWLCGNLTDFKIHNPRAIGLNRLLYFELLPCLGKDCEKNSDKVKSRINNMMVTTKIVHQVFYPEYYDKKKIMNYTHGHVCNDQLEEQNIYTCALEIQQNQISFQNTIFNGIEAFLFGFITDTNTNIIELTTYPSQVYAQRSYMRMDSLLSYYSVSVLQSPTQHNITWSRQNIVQILSNLGGIFSLTWFIFGQISPYQIFRYNNSVIKHIYSREKGLTEKKVNRTKQLYSVRDQAELQLEATARSRRPHQLSLCDGILKCLFYNDQCSKCCRPCCENRFLNKKKLFDIHSKALLKFSQELDVISFIKRARMTKILSDMQLNKTQRPLVKLFKKYHLQNDESANSDVDLLMDEGFNPGTDKIDSYFFKQIFSDKKFEESHQSDDQIHQISVQQSESQKILNSLDMTQPRIEPTDDSTLKNDYQDQD